MLNPGIIHHDVDPPETLDRFRHCRLARLTITEVGLEKGRPDGIRRCLSLGIEIHRQHLMAKLAEMSHNRLTDTTGGTGYQSDARNRGYCLGHGCILIGYCFYRVLAVSELNPESASEPAPFRRYQTVSSPCPSSAVPDGCPPHVKSGQTDHRAVRNATATPLSQALRR